MGTFRCRTLNRLLNRGVFRKIVERVQDSLLAGCGLHAPRLAGVRVRDHVWLINPSLRTLEVYRLEVGRWTVVDTYEDDAVVRAEPFDAIALELGVLWVG